MLIENGGKPYVFVWVDFPDGGSPADTTVEMALVAEGADPTPPQWHTAAWQGEEARYQVDTAVYPDGFYNAKLRLTRGAEVVVKTAGRVRIGDADT
jgi:hypothetical protein